MPTSKLPILAEVAIFSAIALVFDKIPLFTMPQGGSVSLVMLPILLLALRHGLGVGVLTGGIVGTIQLFYGGYFLNVFQVFLDYAFSYAGIGLAGLVAPTLSKQNNLKMLLSSLLWLVFQEEASDCQPPSYQELFSTQTTLQMVCLSGSIPLPTISAIFFLPQQLPLFCSFYSIEQDQVLQSLTKTACWILSNRQSF